MRPFGGLRAMARNPPAFRIYCLSLAATSVSVIVSSMR
jgi:hypothetical protein